jgi:hypothetical protein
MHQSAQPLHRRLLGVLKQALQHFTRLPPFIVLELEDVRERDTLTRHQGSGGRIRQVAIFLGERKKTELRSGFWSAVVVG